MLRRFVFTLTFLPLLAWPQAKRAFNLDDLGKLVDVRDPQCAPDGKSVAYVQSQVDVKGDKAGNSHIWTISLDGGQDQQITTSESSESAPRWSPDGKYLAFTSSRPGKVSGNQVWLLPRSGGEAWQLTGLEARKGRITGFEWSPDSTRLALIVADPDPNCGSGCGGGDGGRRRARGTRRQRSGAETHRDRPLPLQAGRARVFAVRPPQLHRTLRPCQ